ncbi:zinc ribbon domain-containing protein [Cerasicoccus maritimus]|uniref:zinc ribbon domain-containing protein n=1 Tax=Cerasicoccus maritimus TaxID=490089 RepID=UPI0028527E9C|nr:zinc ribbon domain-containing protein [Cerasicoccus maritimus]
MSRHISNERKGAYYIGMGLMILGGLLFASNFLFVASSMSSGPSFGGPGFGGGGSSIVGGMVARALGGMALIVIGGIIRGIGARGLAGSGVVLNPQQARRDLEPYSRMAGGMIKDAVDESGIDLGGSSRRSEPEKVVMIKCRECGKLNEEDSKFCQECGKPI